MKTTSSGLLPEIAVLPDGGVHYFEVDQMLALAQDRRREIGETIAACRRLAVQERILRARLAHTRQSAVFLRTRISELLPLYRSSWRDFVQVFEERQKQKRH